MMGDERDIVERLRRFVHEANGRLMASAHTSSSRGSVTMGEAEYGAVMQREREAADEIERLRALLSSPAGTTLSQIVEYVRLHEKHGTIEVALDTTPAVLRFDCCLCAANLQVLSSPEAGAEDDLPNRAPEALKALRERGGKRINDPRLRATDEGGGK